MGRITLLGAGASAAVVYLLRDDFLIDEAAPMVTPRTCNPGPGIITVDDECYISSEQFYLKDTSSQKGFISTASFARRAGLAVAIYRVSADIAYYWHGFATAAGAARGNLSSNSFYNNLSDGSSGQCYSSLDTGDWCCLIARSTGMIYLVKYVSGWKIVYIDKLSSLTPLYVAGKTWDVNPVKKYIFKKLRVFQLGGEWASDYGIATDRKAIAIAGDTLTHIADTWIDFTWSAVTGETINIMVRRTDDSNCWIIRGSQGGSTVKLIQVQGGVETERGSAAQVFTNGVSYRFFIVAEGNIIAVWVNELYKTAYASASFNNTATGAKVDKGGTDFVAYPFTVIGSAKAELEKFMP